jgi:SAM-dependent methyltransferase
MNIIEHIKLANRSSKYESVSFWRALSRISNFIKTKNNLLSMLKTEGLQDTWPLAKSRPYLFDIDAEGGSTQGHYFHQDLLVARKIFEKRPQKHLDVGSRIDGFVAHLCCFMQIAVADIRPLVSTITNLSFVQADMMEELPLGMRQGYESVSCLHALEHFGLGRYGDPLDVKGHVKGIKQLKNALTPGGTLYLSVPIGRQRIEFNAHRVFSISHVLELVGGDFILEAFHYVDDAGDLHENESAEGASANNNHGCQYGCGIFIFKKKE